MPALRELFEEVRRIGRVGPPVHPGEFQAATSELRLPDDLARFFLEVGDGALLDFKVTEFRLSGLDELRSPAFLPRDADVKWLVICDVGDGDCVAIDQQTVDGSRCNVIDAFHETAGEPGWSTVIALSFAEFLERALATGRRYWLDPEFRGYGDAFDVDIDRS